MEVYYGPEGDQRFWYEPAEIENMAADLLHSAGLTPTVTEPVVDLERFIEGHLRADLDQYADLPADVLGHTQFPLHGRPVVSVNRALTSAADEVGATTSAIGRWRATLAHEASHIYLHRYLFDPEMAPLASVNQQPLPQQAAGDRLMRCLHRDVSPVTAADLGASRRRRDWREVQANRGMAALLMPQRTFRRVGLQEMSRLEISGTTEGTDATDLADALAGIFQVSRQAAGIRLQTLGLLNPPI